MFKIADFGFGRECFKKMGRLFPIRSRFIAPEILYSILVSSQEEEDELRSVWRDKVDVFSLGAIFYWLCAGNYPYDSISEAMDERYCAKYKIESNVKQEDGKVTIDKMLKRNPEHRTSITNVIQALL